MNPGILGCCVYSFRDKFYVWKPQEVAQDSSARPPDHFLMVQHPSAHFPGCNAAPGVLGCDRTAKFTVDRASRIK